MAHADFVHLRVHSAYSLSEGAIKIKELIALCRDRRMPAVAVTDTGNMFGALEFCVAAAAGGVQPIVGTLFPVSRADTATGAGAGRSGASSGPDHIVLLAQDETGYQNLMALISRAYLDSGAVDAPQIALEDLARRSDGVLVEHQAHRAA